MLLLLLLGLFQAFGCLLQQLRVAGKFSCLARKFCSGDERKKRDPLIIQASRRLKFQELGACLLVGVQILVSFAASGFLLCRDDDGRGRCGK